MEKTNSRYTYVTFGNEVIELAAAALAAKLIDGTAAARLTEKATALVGTQTKKAEYNKANPKKTAPKGASEKTQATANALAALLTAEPMTAAELNEIGGTEFTALQVANAMKFIPNAESVKVIRDSVNAKGLKAQKEYTAYKLAE